MKNLNAIVEECRLDIESLGIELGNIKEVTINTRAASRWGQCRKRGGVYYIDISASLLTDDIDDMATKNTVAHELLHTIKGGMKHTGEWKAAAEKLNAVYGYHIKRCTSSEEKGIEVAADSAKYKHIIYCTGCGAKIYYQKDSKVVTSVKMGSTRYRCGLCKHTLAYKSA